MTVTHTATPTKSVMTRQVAGRSSRKTGHGLQLWLYGLYTLIFLYLGVLVVAFIATSPATARLRDSLFTNQPPGNGTAEQAVVNPSAAASTVAPTVTVSPTATLTATLTPTIPATLTETLTATPSITPTDEPSPTPLPTDTLEPTPVTPPTAAIPAPGARSSSGGGGPKWIEVDLSEQMVYAWEGKTLVASFVVSTGASPYRTVTGSWPIYEKHLAGNMWGPGYFLPDVPYIMYFYKGYALHGTYWHTNFGTPMSHGCVNLSIPDAEWLYYWAPIGTSVKVHN